MKTKYLRTVCLGASLLFLGLPSAAISASSAVHLQAKYDLVNPMSTCAIEHDCMFMLDFHPPQIVMGERVRFSTCIAKKGKVFLEFQSSWPGKTQSNWIKIVSATSYKMPGDCLPGKPFFVTFAFTASKNTTNLGRVEYRVKVGNAAPLGKWTGATYENTEAALAGNVPGVPASVSLTSPVTNLQGFIDQYAQSVVTVMCDGVQGSGVSVLFGASIENTAKGYQSKIITNEHVIFDCLTIDNVGKDVVVTVLYKGVEYVGYATTYPSWNDVQSGLSPDLAAIMTTAKIPQSSYWNVVQPALGHSVVAVGTAGGVPNVTTRGDIAGITSTKIVTTAPAGHGSSGGALFSTRGQLLGFITAANATLVEVIPISELCKVIFACTTPIAFVP